jgi:hypothetical protein
MKLTKREKILLLGGLFAVAIAVFVIYVYQPLTKEVDKLQFQSEELTFRLQEVKSKQGQIEELEDKLDTLQKEITAKHSDVFKIWDQAELLVFVEETIDDLCEKESIDFFDVTKTDSIQSGDIALKFKTDYDGLQTIWDRFEKAKYFNTVITFELAKSEEETFIQPTSGISDTEAEGEDSLLAANTGDTQAVDTNNTQAANAEELEVTMNLRFYAQNTADPYPEEYDFMNGVYGKDNIFH